MSGAKALQQLQSVVESFSDEQRSRLGQFLLFALLGLLFACCFQKPRNLIIFRESSLKLCQQCYGFVERTRCQEIARFHQRLNLALLRFILMRRLEQVFDVCFAGKFLLQTRKQRDAFLVPVSRQKFSRFRQSFQLALFPFFLNNTPEQPWNFNIRGELLSEVLKQCGAFLVLP